MSEERIERISVTATIEVGSCTVEGFVKRVDEESISKDAHELQTVMMLAIGKTMKEMVAEIFGQVDEAEDAVARAPALVEKEVGRE